MWNDYATAIGLGLVLSLVAFVVARIALVAGEHSIERRYGKVGLRKMMMQRAKLEQGLEARRAKRLEEIRKLDSEVKEIFIRRQRLERELVDAKAASERLVRLIGEEVEGTPSFVAKVINKYVGVGPAQMRGPILVDRSWAQPQEMEVWARSVAEARSEIERRYPPAFGFHITRLNERGTQDSSGADEIAS